MLQQEAIENKGTTEDSVDSNAIKILREIIIIFGKNGIIQALKLSLTSIQ